MHHSLLSHRLLLRQLKKNNIDVGELPENWQTFIAQIHESYLHFEDNRTLVERAMRLSSEELEEKNKLLHTESENQKLLIETLSGAFKSITIDKSELHDGDLKSISSQLNRAIAERKNMEKDLIAARETAEQSLATRQLFLANISHEVRTPLNAILGMSAILESSPMNEEQLEFIAAIRSSSEGLLVIINDILDMTKMESGRFGLETIVFDLHQIVKLLIRSQSVRANQKNIELLLDFDKRIQPQLMGDPTRLNQIISNLISNAIKFTNQGHVKLSIQIKDQSSDTQTIRFEVEDTGIGIEENKIQLIFEEFTQEDETITRRYGGTGLGLAISKNLIELMGGTIQVSSIKDVGSIFRFDLAFPISFEEFKPKNSLQRDSNLRNARILIVEDNELNRFLAITLLKRWNAIPLVAIHGSDAVEILRKNSVDLILMDLQMPVEDGFLATDRIRLELNIHTPIIALTANALESERLLCLERGMNDYLSKPYLPEDLFNIIVNHLPPMEITSRPPIALDLSKLSALYSGNEEHIRKTSSIFALQISREKEVLLSCLENKAFTEIKGLAHKMKPSFALYKIDPAVLCITQLEIAATDKKISTVEHLVHELVAMIDETIVLLEAL
jgi:signal transduction histidine kinase/DNA-binding response OmpR family regulator